MTCGCCACVVTNEADGGALKALITAVETGDIARDSTIHLITETGESAGDASTTASMSVGETFLGTLDFAGDDDWISLSVAEDGYYTISLDGGGANPLSDPYLRLYNASGSLIGANDDSNASYNSEVFLSLTARETYYISARAYGDRYVGDYVVSVEEGGGGASGADLVDAIDWGAQLNTNTVRVYFAAEGETIGGVTSEAWLDYEIEAALDSLDDVSRFTNLSYERVMNAGSADFRLVVADDIGGGLGWFYPPGAGGANSGVGAFARGGRGWSQDGLGEGGYGRVTLTHEFGHGLGLAHPHDSGASEIMDGVSTAFGDFGDYLLNQGVFTTMSYNTGWDAENGGGHSTNYGWENGFAALDIAVLQEKYGANEAYAIGDDAYALPTSNTSGAFYETIWDADGSDEITYGGSNDAVIDLRAATLEYDPGGAGFISYVEGVLGGFTIANGVEIENARGGRGDDDITGNDARNDLRGGRGADEINGGARADWLRGNGGKDTLFGDDGNDRMWGGRGADTLFGGDGNDRMWGGRAADTFVFEENGGNDRIGGFEDGLDMLRFDIAGLAFDDLTITQINQHTTIDYGEGTVRLNRVDSGLIDENDFIFADQNDNFAFA